MSKRAFPEPLSLAVAAAAVAALSLVAADRPRTRGALLAETVRAPAPTLDRAIDSIARSALAQHRIPGLSIAVVRNVDARPRIIFARGYGVTDSARAIRVDTGTVFQLGSISKQFLAALVLRLAERDRLSLDDPVRRHLPAFAHLPPTITVRHLLNHTAGIREPFTLAAYQAGIEDLDRGSAELVEILRAAPHDFDPGSRWSYSNGNYLLLALIVEAVTDQPYDRVLARDLLRRRGGHDPLRSLHHCTPLPRGPRDARGHVLQADRVVPSAPENMRWIRGDGGLCATALDVARWAVRLPAGAYISRRSYALLTSPTRLTSGREVDYGFGSSLVDLDGRRKISHNGAMLGFSASAAYYPDSGVAIVVLANRGDVRTETIERAIARRLLGLPTPTYPPVSLSADERRAFAGRYDIGVMPVDVALRGEQLWVVMAPPGPTEPLRYIGNDTFVTEANPDGYRLTFRRDADGRPHALRLYMGGMHWYGDRVHQP